MTPISLDTPAGQSLADLALQRCSGPDNCRQLQHLTRRLHQARQQELTQRQGQILSLYYDRGLSMRQIAQRLQINSSTVCRTLQRARRRLQRSLRYCL